MSEASPRLTAEFVARALGTAAPPASGGAIEFSSVTTDSRSVPKGALFVAIQGEKFDGHDFVAEAVAQEAAGVLCRERTAVPSGALAFHVPETLSGYRRLAGAWRREFHFPVVAVAGAVGKTTTKDMLAAILSGRWPSVLRTAQSQNGYLGIAITLMQLRASHGAAVIEIGIDEPGAMKAHLEIVRPDAALVTAVGPEHLEKLGTIERVAEEETRALAHVSSHGGRAIVNLDDPWVREWIEGASRAPGFDPKRHLCYALGPDPKAPGGCPVLRGAAVNGAIALEGAGLGGEPLPLPLPGEHNARNLLAAAAAAAALGLSVQEIRQGLKSFQPGFGRTDVRSLQGGITVLCDYYNANPTSMRAALSLLRELGTKPGGAGALWACLGDMLELGPDEERFHRELASDIVSNGVTRVLFLGNRMAWLGDELARRSYPGVVRQFDSREELGRALASGLRTGDRVLIKGSRGMRMEEVWKILDLHAKNRS